MLLNGDIDFFIVSDIPDDKVADITLINAMLVRGSGAIESIATVPAMRAKDAVSRMQKAQEMASQWRMKHHPNPDNKICSE